MKLTFLSKYANKQKKVDDKDIFSFFLPWKEIKPNYFYWDVLYKKEKKIPKSMLVKNCSVDQILKKNIKKLSNHGIFCFFEGTWNPSSVAVCHFISS